MLDVSQISEILDITPQQVYNHIDNENLKADKRGGKYVVKLKDFNDFQDFFYETKHKSKGFKTPNPKQFETMQEFIEDIKNKDIPYEVFLSKYRDIDKLIAPIKNFIKFKRDLQIVYDFKIKKLNQNELSTKYNLSKRSIEEITRSKKNYIKIY